MDCGGQLKCVIIGFGVLGQYIVPCCERLLGGRLEGNLFAVKKTGRGLDGLRARFPFCVQAGGTRELLDRVRPDVVVLAVKPDQAAGVLSGALSPYLGALRREGAPLPDVYSFVSKPTVEAYAPILGSDVNIACMIPSMQREVGGHPVAPIGVSFLAFDPARQWPAANRRRALDFLGATGNVLEVAPGQMSGFIALNCAAHVMYEFNYRLTEALAARGVPAPLSRTAQTFRKCFRGRFDDPATAIVPCDGAIDAPEVCRCARTLMEAWHDGLLDYAREEGIGEAPAHRHVSGSMELFQIEVQFHSRQALEEITRAHATPGGFTQRAVRFFAERCDGLCRRTIDRCLDGGDPAGMADALRDAARRCARETAGLGR